MITSYPLGPIAVGIALAFSAATCVGSAIACTGFALPGGHRRIGCIDGLRGYLAMGVLAHHFVIWLQITRLGIGWSDPAVNVLNNLGAAGVALFFMITGLVFYPTILSGFSGTSWLSLYVTRVFRIVPLLVVSVATVVVIIMHRTRLALAPEDAKAAIAWITTWSQPPFLGYSDSGRVDAYVLWSIMFEWVFYIVLLPILALCMDVIRNRLPSWTLPASLFFITFLARKIPYLQQLHAHQMQFLPKYIPLFALGMLAYEVQRRAKLVTFFKSRPATVIALTSLGYGMMRAPTPYDFFQLLLFGVFFTSIACGNSVFGIFKTRGALVLGECSFGIYLFHGIVLDVLFIDGFRFTTGLTVYELILLLPCVAAIVVCITAVTYHAVEKPMIAKGKQVTKMVGRSSIIVSAQQFEVAP